jgi:large subunit ribosomal protein L21
MYAIVEIGGKQYKAEKGATLRVDHLSAKENEKIKIKEVLFLHTDKKDIIGQPYVKDAVVECKVVKAEEKGEKLTVFKYKPKTNYSVKRGYRHTFTVLEVVAIQEKAKEAVEA